MASTGCILIAEQKHAGLGISQGQNMRDCGGPTGGWEENSSGLGMYNMLCDTCDVGMNTMRGCRQPGSAMVSPACAAALCQELLAWLSPGLVAAVVSTSTSVSNCWLQCLAAAQQLLSAVATLQPKVHPNAAILTDL